MRLLKILRFRIIRSNEVKPQALFHRQNDLQSHFLRRLSILHRTKKIILLLSYIENVLMFIIFARSVTNVIQHTTDGAYFFYLADFVTLWTYFSRMMIVHNNILLWNHQYFKWRLFRSGKAIFGIYFQASESRWVFMH